MEVLCGLRCMATSDMRWFMRFCDPEPFPPKTEFLSTTDGREDGEMIRSPIDHCWSWRGFLTQVKVHIPDIETD